MHDSIASFPDLQRTCPRDLYFHWKQNFPQFLVLDHQEPFQILPKARRTQRLRTFNKRTTLGLFHFSNQFRLYFGFKIPTKLHKLSQSPAQNLYQISGSNYRPNLRQLIPQHSINISNPEKHQEVLS